MTQEKNYDGLILEHYRKVALNFSLRPESTMEDAYIRNAEVAFVMKEVGRYREEIHPSPSILDVGCGNGHLLTQLREKFPDSRLYGREFTPELLELALSRQLSDVDVAGGDCRSKTFFKDKNEKVDLIITERVIINIKDREDQLAALENLAGLLKAGGRYIMIESFEGPLALINKAAMEMSLPLLSQSKQNLYLDEDIITAMGEMGFKELVPLMPSNFLSTHFFNTRILHRSARRPGGKVKNTEFVRFLDLALPPAIGNYSPILMRVFSI